MHKLLTKSFHSNKSVIKLRLTTIASSNLLYIFQNKKSFFRAALVNLSEVNKQK